MAGITVETVKFRQVIYKWIEMISSAHTRTTHKMLGYMFLFQIYL